MSKTGSLARSTPHIFSSHTLLSLGILCASFGCAGEIDGEITETTLTDLSLVDQVSEPQLERCLQTDLLAITDPFERFIAAFDCGDELFEARFNALDGVGANVGDGQRFTRVPRADKQGADEWANHFPPRATGPNAEACNACHDQPFDDGAGLAVANAIRDPFQTGDVSQFINRNTPHVFAPGALQLLAEEMTDELQFLREFGREISCLFGGVALPVPLRAKGVRFGVIVVSCDGNDDTSFLDGVNDDLVLRPFSWKGSDASLRIFNRGAAHNELGMQPVEITGDDFDGDGDGITNEFGIGDMTALAIYLAAQPRPVTKLELAELGLIELSAEEVASIQNGEQIFDDLGCDSCHKPSLFVRNPIFSEPSQNLNYREDIFPAGQDALAVNVDPNNPVTFDITTDPPDNIIEFNGEQVLLGAFETDQQGNAIIRLFGDLKRHDMGPGLAENIDEIGTGASVWLTTELWGVGSTAPYLHDGRATTLPEAILAHGGEAQDEQENFVALSAAAQADLVAFLNNLVLFKLEEEE